MKDIDQRLREWLPDQVEDPRSAPPRLETTEPHKSFEQRIRECKTSQEIADLQAQRSGSIEHVEGSRSLSLPVAKSGRVHVQCSSPEVAGTRDGLVSIPYSQLENALRLDPSLRVIAIGENTELQERIDACRDSSELAQLLVEARQGKL
jgi:hypothetical protein